MLQTLRWLAVRVDSATSFTESGRKQHTATVFTPPLLHCQGWGGRTPAVEGSERQPRSLIALLLLETQSR